MFRGLSINKLVLEFSGNGGILVVSIYGVSQQVSGVDVFACQCLFVLEVCLTSDVNEA